MNFFGRIKALLIITLFSTILFCEEKKDDGEIYTVEQRIMVAKDASRKSPEFARGILRPIIKDLEAKENRSKKDNELLVDAYYSMGIIATNKQEDKTAIQWFNNALSVEHSHFNSLFLRGRLFYLNYRFCDAKIDLNQCLKLKPNDKNTLITLQQMEDYLKANPDAEDLSESLKNKKK